MKKIVSALLILFWCQTASANTLDGVWELISGEYVNEKGELVDYESIELHSIKIIANSHFSFTSMKGDRFWASGAGTYEMANGKYTEKLQHNSFGEKPGTTFTFDTKVEENYWYNTRWKGEKRVEYEVWRKID
ncbi:hypothetical protein [Microbulbifer pacificus]|uniref:hypothetical protein n=1 Tax=Microbulbifer pacificus TaxID=407164 RepID=UPI000CF5396A|nr:hypothetical protein [Microbulbifer pacificus]